MTKIINIKCPKCLNKMVAKKYDNGRIQGTCPICHSTIISKERTKETLIRIVNHNN